MSNLKRRYEAAAIRRGNEAAFRRYYERTLLYLVAKIQKLTGDRDEAWDIAQDTFVKLWESREWINPARSLDGFVVAMATNAAHDAWKKKQTAARWLDEQTATLTEDAALAADARILRREAQREIDAIVEAMPPQRRTVYRMSREEGLTYNEIAERLNISPATVNRHMSIALKELRDFISVLAAIIIASSA